MSVLLLLTLLQEPGKEAFEELRQIATAEALIRATGAERLEYWVRDVAGLAPAFRPENMKDLRDRLVRIAAADGAAAAPRPIGGYVFRAVPKVDGKPLDVRDGWNPSRFAFVALPTSYPNAGRLSFLITPENVPYAKDTGGSLPDSVPEKPGQDGWMRVDRWPPPALPAPAAAAVDIPFAPLGGPPAALKFAADGRLFAALADKPAVRVYDAAGKASTLNEAAAPEPVVSMDVAGDRVALGTWTGKVRILGGAAWDVAARRVHEVAFTPHGLLTLSFETRSSRITLKGQLWDVETAREIRAMPEAELAGVPPDGSFLILRDAAGFLKWDAGKGTSTPIRPMRGYAVDGVWRATPAGDLLFGHARGEGTGFLRPAQKEPYQKLKGTAGTFFALHPAGKMGASGAEDGAVWLWTSEGAPIRTLGSHAKPVRALAFSPDGRRLASAAEDGALKIWPLAP